MASSSAGASAPGAAASAAGASAQQVKESAERLKQLMQDVPFYAIKGSPVNESPLGLFSPERDAAQLEAEYGIPKRYLTGIPSPWAVKRLVEFERPRAVHQDLVDGNREIARFEKKRAAVRDSRMGGGIVRRRLHRVAERNAPLCAVTEQLAKTRRIVGRGDHQNLADPGQHEDREGIVDHRFVEDRKQLLRNRKGQGVKASPSAACKNYAFHDSNPLAALMHST